MRSFGERQKLSPGLPIGGDVVVNHREKNAVKLFVRPIAGARRSTMAIGAATFETGIVGYKRRDEKWEP